jgi:DNA-binding XRE family transcriptional regulator
MLSSERRLGPQGEMFRLGVELGLDIFINIDKLVTMRAGQNRRISPIGRTVADVAEDQARRSEAYREARDEYAAIRELRKRNWIAAHIRERRYELDLTQKRVAEQAGTSHSFISKVESGDHMPTIPVLKRILAVLDEELLIGFERRTPDEEPEREVAPAPELAAA